MTPGKKKPRGPLPSYELVKEKGRRLTEGQKRHREHIKEQKRLREEKVKKELESKARRAETTRLRKEYEGILEIESRISEARARKLERVRELEWTPGLRRSWGKSPREYREEAAKLKKELDRYKKQRKDFEKEHPKVVKSLKRVK